MSSVAPAAVSEAAAPATTPAPTTAPAPEVSAPSGQEASRATQALMPNEQSILRKIQEATLKATATESVPGEAETLATATDTEPAPDSGEGQEPEEVATDGQQPEGAEEGQTAREVPQIPYDELPDNMRAELRRANLDPKVKEALATSWYLGKALHDTGYSIKQLQDLKASGFTPDAAVERIKLHPTLADAQRDAQLAMLGRALVNDYRENPRAMIEGLARNTPQAFPAFAQAFAGALREAAPEAYGSVVSDAFWNALQIMDGEIPEEDIEGKEHIAWVRSKLFPDSAQRRPEFNPADPIHQRYQQLQQQQHAFRVQQAQAFDQALLGYSEEAVRSEIKARLEQAAQKSGMPPQAVERAANDVFEGVRQAILSNPSLMAEVERFRRSDLSQDALNAAVTYVLDRARAIIPIHQKSAMEWWASIMPQSTTPAISARPPARPAAAAGQAPSASKVPGSAPPVGKPKQPPAAFIAEGRRRGWDNFRMMQEWLKQ